jgi:hypothetical protein
LWVLTLRARLLQRAGWFYPDGQDPKLIYCNQDNQLFELNFVPTEDWILSLETE